MKVHSRKQLHRNVGGCRFFLDKMESTVSRYRTNINQFFEKILETKCEIRIAECLDKLLAVLSQQETKGWCCGDRFISVSNIVDL
jgi:hypothetical protein